MKPIDLTEIQRVDALKRYYANEPVQSIIDAYGLDCHRCSFIREFPPTRLPERLCPSCGIAMVVRPQTRYLAKSGRSNLLEATCERCGHRDTPRCSCSFCVSKRPKRPKRRRPEHLLSHLQASWIDAFAIRPEPADLSVRQAVYLLAAAHGGLYPGGEVIPSIQTLGERVAPTRDYTRALVRTLVDASLLAVDPDRYFCPPTVDLRSYLARHADTAYWRLTLGLDGSENKQYLTELTAIVAERWTAETHGDELVDLWAEAALEECVANVQWQLSHFGLATSVTFDLRETLRTLLGYLACGEVFAATWTATKHVAAEHHAGRSHCESAQAVEAHLRALFSRILDGCFKPFLFERIRYRPASALAQVLEGPVLKIGPRYLTSAPLMSNLLTEPT